MLAVRWYLRYGLSYRDLEGLLAERGITVDETYGKVAGVWRYVYRAVDEDGQNLDVYVARRRDTAAAAWFLAKALRDHGEPLEIVTDKSPTLASVIADLVPDVEHCTDQYANNRIECDHGRLKARLRPMRGLKTDRTASTVIRGHALVQTSGEATTNSTMTPIRPADSRRRSTISWRPCAVEADRTCHLTRPSPPQRNSA